MRTVFRLFVILSATPMLAVAPHSAVAAEQDFGAWAIFSTTDHFTDDGEPTRWRYAFDAQARFSDIGGGSSQYLARPAVGYDINDNVSAWVGYARIWTEAGSGATATENRYWQQLAWTALRRETSRLTMRLRMEQRSVSVSDDVGLTLRYQLRYSRQSAAMPSLEYVASIEPIWFLRDTDWGGDARLSQNRLFLGVGKQLSARYTLELGYLNQYVLLDNSENVSNNLAVVHLKAKL